LSELELEPTKYDEVIEALKDVIDPEIGVNIVDLGLIYGLNKAEDESLLINMTLTSAGCPLTDVLEEQTAEALDGVVGSGCRLGVLRKSPKMVASKCAPSVSPSKASTIKPGQPRHFDSSRVDWVFCWSAILLTQSINYGDIHD
jgi:metal-sulfur cluster biosynthetic enzyme